ncbi:MAG: hypothetical protein O9327_02545 [Polaromonas sp.]|nr:hypothetical protein [Polaromonas sp.]
MLLDQLPSAEALLVIPPTALRSVSLYCTQGSSNKEYHLSLVADGEGFLVNYRYGPRGRANRVGSKTPAPVSREAADKVFDRVLQGQLKDGYTENESGQPYLGTEKSGLVSGWLPMLLSPMASTGLDMEHFLRSSEWVASEKMNGDRRGFRIETSLLGMNRKGLFVGIPSSWERSILDVPVGSDLDGEHVGDRLWLFDATRIGFKDIRHLGFVARRAELARVMASAATSEQGGDVRVIPLATSEADKRRLLAEVEAKGGEGLVFNRVDAPYTEGVSPHAVKFVFKESSTCMVSGINQGKRSVALMLFDDREGLPLADRVRVPMGNVTIPNGQPIPDVGSLVEVRYMHWFEGGSLYQPVYLGARRDLDPDAARLSQVTRIVPRAGD